VSGAVPKCGRKRISLYTMRLYWLSHLSRKVTARANISSVPLQIIALGLGDDTPT